MAHDRFRRDCSRCRYAPPIAAERGFRKRWCRLGLRLVAACGICPSFWYWPRASAPVNPRSDVPDQQRGIHV